MTTAYRVTLRRVSDGLERSFERNTYGCDADGLWYIWTEGNQSCDGNRAADFARAGGEEKPAAHECGEGAFELVHLVMPSGIDLCGNLEEAKLELLGVMETLSQACYLAGWHDDLEHLLERDWRKITHPMIAGYRDLMTRCDGVWMWQDGEHPTFASLTEFQFAHSVWLTLDRSHWHSDAF